MRRKSTFLTIFVFLLALFSMKNMQAQDLNNYVGPVVFNQMGDLHDWNGQNSYEKFDDGIIKSSYAAADDFIVPAGNPMKISTIYVKGSSSNDPSMLWGFNVTIYSDVRMPADTIKYFHALTSFVRSEHDYLINLGEEIELNPGAYWISVQSVSGYGWNSDWTAQYDYNWKWRSLSNETHIEMQPYKKSYQTSNAATAVWKEADTWSVQNMAFSLHTSLAKDLTARMVSPTTGPNMTNAEMIGIEIFNAGTEAQNGFEVQYAINGGNPVVETVAATIDPFSAYGYEFAQKADLSEAGDYSIEVTVNLTGDENVSNNSTVATLTNQGKVIYLDENTASQTILACSGRFTDEGGLGGNIAAFDQNYFTTIKPDGTNQRSVLEFTEIEILVSGWFGDEIAGEINVYDGEDNTKPLLATLPTKLTIDEEPIVITATNATGALTVEFVATAGMWQPLEVPGWIANMSCITPAENDLAIVDVVSPNYDADFTTTEQVTISIKNYGYKTQTEVPVSYVLNDGTAVTGTLASIATGETVDFTFDGTEDLTAPSTYVFDFELTLAGDDTPENNVFTKVINNYGTVYRINADTILNDTLSVCSGVLTDAGGPDASGETSSHELGYEMPTLLWPQEDGYRMELEILALELGNGALNIYNDTVRNDDMGERLTDKNPNVGAKYIGTNVHGAMFINYVTPYSGVVAPGFIARLNCVKIEDNDLMISNLSKSKVILRVDEMIEFSASVQNIGNLEFGNNVVLTIDGVGVDTIIIDALAPFEYAEVVFSYTPEVAGNYEVALVLGDDDGDAYFNSVQLDLEVYKYRQLAETFMTEGGPLGWQSKQGQWRQNTTMTSFHESGYMSTQRIDTLHTLPLSIADGDSLVYYANSTIYGIWGSPPTPGDAKLKVGWYNRETGEYKLFPEEEVYGLENIRCVVDISEAAGVNEIVFINTVDYRPIEIDFVVGPMYVLEGSDIELLSFENGTFVKTGQEFDFDISLRSLGDDNLTGEEYTIDLYNEGDETPFHREPGYAITALETVDYTFSYTFAEATELNVYAVVNFELDDDLENNISESNSILVIDLNTIDVVVGDEESNSGSRDLLDTYKNYGVSEMLFYLEQINQTGDIKALAFYKKFATDVEDVFVKIWIGETDSVSLEGGFVPGDELNVVFEDTLDLKANSNFAEYVIPFTTPYNYQGGNLALMVYQSSPNGNYSNYWRYTYGMDSLNLRYVNSADSIDVNGVDFGELNQSNRYNLFNTMFLFDASADVIATVKDGAGNLIEGVTATMTVNNADVYSTTSDADGVITFEDVAYDNTYMVSFAKDGYEYYSEELAVVNGENNMGDIIIDPITSPVNLVTIVDNVAKTATTTWGTSKVFSHYNVYLDNNIVAENVTQSEYTYTELADGMHVAGVTSVYDGGMSEMSVDTFYVVYAPINLELFAGVESTLATWDFEGKSEDFYGFVVSFDGFVIDTVTDDQYKFEGYTDGTHTVSVASLYAIGGLSASVEESFTNLLAPMNLTATHTGGRELVAAWEVAETSVVDSFSVYFDDMMTPVATGVTEMTYTFTDVEDGNHTIGVSSVYAGKESNMAIYSVIGFVNIETKMLNEVSIYPNPAMDVLNINCPVNSTIEVYSILGGKVIETKAFNNITKLNVAALEQGTYLIKITNNEDVKVERIQIAQ